MSVSQLQVCNHQNVFELEFIKVCRRIDTGSNQQFESAGYAKNNLVALFQSVTGGWFGMVCILRVSIRLEASMYLGVKQNRRATARRLYADMALIAHRFNIKGETP